MRERGAVVMIQGRAVVYRRPPRQRTFAPSLAAMVGSVGESPTAIRVLKRPLSWPLSVACSPHLQGVEQWSDTWGEISLACVPDNAHFAASATSFLRCHPRQLTPPTRVSVRSLLK